MKENGVRQNRRFGRTVIATLYLSADVLKKNNMLITDWLRFKAKASGVFNTCDKQLLMQEYKLNVYIRIPTGYIYKLHADT